MSMVSLKSVEILCALGGIIL